MHRNSSILSISHILITICLRAQLSTFYFLLLRTLDIFRENLYIGSGNLKIRQGLCPEKRNEMKKKDFETALLILGAEFPEFTEEAQLEVSPYSPDPASLEDNVGYALSGINTSIQGMLRILEWLKPRLDEMEHSTLDAIKGILRQHFLRYTEYYDQRMNDLKQRIAEGDKEAELELQRHERKIDFAARAIALGLRGD